jgi:hypothetical protein
VMDPHLVPRSRMSRSYTSSPPKRLHGVKRDCFTFLLLCVLYVLSNGALYVLCKLNFFYFQVDAFPKIITMLIMRFLFRLRIIWHDNTFGQYKQLIFIQQFQIPIFSRYSPARYQFERDSSVSHAKSTFPPLAYSKRLGGTRSSITG